MSKRKPLCPKCQHRIDRHQPAPQGIAVGLRCTANYATPNGTVYRCRCDGTAADAHGRLLVGGTQERATSLARRAARIGVAKRRRRMREEE